MRGPLGERVMAEKKSRGLWSAEVGTTGDNIQVVANSNNTSLSIEEPWAGSTDTGFGYTCTISLPKEKALEMAAFIVSFYG